MAIPARWDLRCLHLHGTTVLAFVVIKGVFPVLNSHTTVALHVLQAEFRSTEANAILTKYGSSGELICK